MENFVVSARKYRPDRFETVVGQSSITKTLKNAIKANQLAHAYLFCGPRGVGKTTCARIFAKTINCFKLDSDNEACGECESCKSFQQNRSFSIHELDAASNNHVDDIRNLIDQVRIPPQVGKYSIYIIDEVHMLTQQAFNAFLKTLEEPPEHAIFILATTEKHKIIPTILSRCQIFDFNRIGVIEIMDHLKTVAEREKVKFEEAALNIIAQKADGSMRDALSIFDQVVSFSGDFVDYQTVVSNLNVLDYDYYFQLTEYFLEGNYRSALMTYNEILNKGFDSHNFINGLGGHFRNLLVSKDQETIQLLELSGEIAEKYHTTVQKCSLAFLFGCLEEIYASDIQFKQSKDPRLHVEISLLKLSKLNNSTVYQTEKEPIAKVQETASSVQKMEVEEKIETAKNIEKVGKVDEAPEQIVENEVIPITETKITEKPQELNAQDKQGKPQDIVEGKPETEFVKKSQSLGAIPNTPKLSDFMKKRVETTVDVSIESSVELSGSEPVLELNEKNLILAWKDFAEKIKTDQPRMYNTLINQSPELQGKTIHLNLSNPLQKKAVASIHHEIEGYIKKRTATPDIVLQTAVSEGMVVEKKIFTQDEKYNHLKQMNPNLDMFKQKMNLDFE